MEILFSIITFHLLAILAGRKIREMNMRGVTIVFILTLLLVAAVFYGLFTMENPEIGN